MTNLNMWLRSQQFPQIHGCSNTWCMLMCVAAERVARLEKEAQSLKRVSEEVFRVQKQIDSEKLARESASGQLQSDLQQLLSKLPAATSSCKQRTSSLHLLDRPLLA